MSLNAFVKVNHVNNLSDARYCAAMGVNLIGFDAKKINPQAFNEITGWLSGISFAIELNDLESYNDYESEFIESSDLKTIQNSNKKTIYRLNINLLETLHDLDVNFLLIDGLTKKTTPEQIERIKKLSNEYNIILECDDGIEFLLELVKKTGVYAMAIDAGDEERPGYKNYDELEKFFECLEKIAFE